MLFNIPASGFELNKKTALDAVGVNALFAGGIDLNNAKTLNEYFEPFNQEAVYFYASNGKVSSYQLITYFLKLFTNPIDLTLTTWGITEQAVRKLAQHKKSGRIQRINFVCSEQTKVNKANEFYFMKSLADSFKTIPVHAKIYLMGNANQKLSIVTSANLNRNNKLEAGTITALPQVHDFYFNFLNKTTNGI